MSHPTRIAYITQCEGRAVYLYSDGTHRLEGFEWETLARCKFCNGFTSYTATKQCNGCWEVSSRLQDFLLNEGGRKHAKELIADIEECLGTPLPAPPEDSDS